MSPAAQSHSPERTLRHQNEGGDVAAVKASTDAGADAVDRVNELRREAGAEPTEDLIDTEVDA